MAQSKKTAFEAEEVRLAEYAKALGHPARIAILSILAKEGRCICGELVGELPLAQATVSQHLKALKEVGLVQGEVEGPRSCYCIDPEGLADFRRAMDSFFQTVQPACCTPNSEVSR